MFWIGSSRGRAGDLLSNLWFERLCGTRRFVRLLHVQNGHRFRELLLNPRYERWRWQTFGITWLIYASFYLTRQSFSRRQGGDPDAPRSFADAQQT